MSTPALFVSCARGLIGTPWRHRGRNERGVDCIGLVEVSSMRAGMCGLMLSREERRYGREPWNDTLRAGCRVRWGEPLSPKDARPGDIALVRWGVSEPQHMGIVGNHPNGGLSLIHAHNGRGVVEQGLSGPILAAVLEVYRPSWGDA